MAGFASRSDSTRGIRDRIAITLFRNPIPLPPVVVAAAAPRPITRRNPMPAANRVQPPMSRGRF